MGFDFLSGRISSCVAGKGDREGAGGENSRPRQRLKGWQIQVSNGTVISQAYVRGEPFPTPEQRQPYLFATRECCSKFIRARKADCKARRVYCLFSTNRYCFVPVYGY